MATDVVSRDQVGKTQGTFSLFSGRRGRLLQENLTAYLFIAPAAILLFTFGIFPIFFAGYVSLYKWRIRQDEFRGLANFVSAMGDLAYVFLGIVALALLFMGLNAGRKALKDAKEHNIPYLFPVFSFLPALITATGLGLVLLKLITFFAQDRAIEAGNAQELGNISIGLLLIVVGIGLSTVLFRRQHLAAAKSPFAVLPNFATPSLTVVVAVGGGLLLGAYTIETLLASEEYAQTVSHIGSVVIGLLALGIAYALWEWSSKQFETKKLIAGILSAAVFIGTGVYFISIWPTITDNGDSDFYLSLTVTVYYAIAAVPTQLAIAMVLAYLLFQDLKGKGFFRVAFFVPYVAPTVAGAAIFNVLFSLREKSIANRIMQFFTNNEALTLSWLKEPNSALSVLGGAFGLESATDWTTGPSLALVVVILFSIWRFVGYDTVIFLAGLGNIPTVLYEAAEIDGANRWQVFRHITLPLLSPTTFFLSVISVIGTFKAFNSIWVLRDTAALSTTDTNSVYFFETFFRGSRFGYATSMAMILFVIILTLTVIQNRIAEKRVFYG